MLSKQQRNPQQNHLPKMGSMILFILIITATLAACGSNGGTGGSPPFTPTPTTAKQVQKCGSVQTTPRGTPLDATSAKQNEGCFWQAFQKCQPASLEFISTSVDTIAIHTFTVQNKGGQCSVSDAVQRAIVPAKPSAAKTYPCIGVVQKPDGLLFSSCGSEGDVLVPSQASK